MSAPPAAADKVGCGNPRCTALVTVGKLACSKHWFQLPKELRRRVYDTYVPGQSALTASDDWWRAFADALEVWEQEAFA